MREWTAWTLRELPDEKLGKLPYDLNREVRTEGHCRASQVGCLLAVEEEFLRC
jgi:hypothetical protein